MFKRPVIVSAQICVLQASEDMPSKVLSFKNCRTHRGPAAERAVRVEGRAVALAPEPQTQHPFPECVAKGWGVDYVVQNGVQLYKV